MGGWVSGFSTTTTPPPPFVPFCPCLAFGYPFRPPSSRAPVLTGLCHCCLRLLALLLAARELCAATSAAITALTQATFGVVNAALLAAPAAPALGSGSSGPASERADTAREPEPVAVPVPGWMVYATALAASVACAAPTPSP